MYCDALGVNASFGIGVLIFGALIFGALMHNSKPTSSLLKHKKIQNREKAGLIRLA
jgi:uncharacterized integral membrane protein